jgi:hypothetical protein
MPLDFDYFDYVDYKENEHETQEESIVYTLKII